MCVEWIRCVILFFFNGPWSNWECITPSSCQSMHVACKIIADLTSCIVQHEPAWYSCVLYTHYITTLHYCSSMCVCVCVCGGRGGLYGYSYIFGTLFISFLDWFVNTIWGQYLRFGLVEADHKNWQWTENIQCHWHVRFSRPSGASLDHYWSTKYIYYIYIYIYIFLFRSIIIF